MAFKARRGEGHVPTIGNLHQFVSYFLLSPATLPRRGALSPLSFHPHRVSSRFPSSATSWERPLSKYHTLRRPVPHRLPLPRAALPTGRLTELLCPTSARPPGSKVSRKLQVKPLTSRPGRGKRKKYPRLWRRTCETPQCHPRMNIGHAINIDFSSTYVVFTRLSIYIYCA